MIIDYFFLALRNLRKRGLRSWLTMLGIFLGIAAVVSLISLGNGLQTAITGQFATLDADKLIIENTGTGFGPPGSTVINKLTDHDIKLISSIPGVEFAISRIIRVVKIEFNKVAQFRYIVNMPPDSDQLDVINEALHVDLLEGRLLTPTDRGKVVLGNDFTDDSFGKKIHAGSTINIQGENFEVVGILKKGSSFQINSVVFMPEDDLKKILNIGDETDLIVVQVREQDKLTTVASEIEKRIRRDRGLKEGEDDFSVQTPVQSVEAINTVLNIINIIVSGIAAISLLVGGIGIANTMYTSVLERTREIGIMKAIGAKRFDILLIFLIESALLGLVGGVVGATIGLSLAFLIAGAAGSFLGGIGLQVAISYPLLFAAILFSLLIGIFSGMLPALQASRLNPVEALRR